MQTRRHQQVQRPRPRPKRLPVSLILGTMGAAMACLVVILIGYLLLGPNVTINAPATGEVLAQNVPTSVQASASHPSGVKRTELYADGALVAAQDSMIQNGANPMILAQSWTPLTTGRHILIARAYPTDGGVVDSTAVAVTVVEQVVNGTTVNTGETPTTVEDIATSTGTSPEDIFEANPDLPPDPGAPLPPDTEVDVPLPPADPPPAEPPPDPAPGAPAPPTDLMITADCDSATLSWTDAPDEESYNIYRLDPPVLTLIGSVAANETGYIDTPLPGLGEFQYQVASVRDGLEGLTPMVSVETPGTCVPPATIEDLILTMETLVTETPWDGVYCYFDFDGTGYLRVPAADFLYMTPEPDGVTYDLSTQLPNSGQFHISGDTSAGITLSGECWGRNGPEVSLLGNISATHGPEDWDGHDLIQSVPLAMTLTYNITTNPPPEPGVFFLPWIDIIWGLLQLPAPTDLHIGPSGAGCSQYTGWQRTFCVLSAALGTGPTTLEWNWTGNSLHSEEQLTRYLVVMRAHDMTSDTESVIWVRNVFRSGPGEEIRRAQILPTEDLPCGSQLILDVQAFKGTQASTVATIPWQETAACPLMHVNVTFNTFHVVPAGGFSSVEDVNDHICIFCFPDDRLELDGAVGANLPRLETGNSGGGFLNPCPDGAWCLEQGDYPVVGLPLSFMGWGIPAPGHNQLNFTLDSDYGLTVWFLFHELDDGVASDASCAALQEFPPTNPVNWPTQINGSHTLTAPMLGSGGGSEGQCVMDLTITGVPVP
jgi:hypothetical protein